MTLSLGMILWLVALLIVGIGVQYIPDLSPRAKGWITFGLCLWAAVIVLYYAGALRIG